MLHYRATTAALLFLLTAASLPGPSAAGRAEAKTGSERPTLIVFDFEYPAKKGNLGFRVAEMFRWHAFRRNAFITLENAPFQEVLQEAGGFSPTIETPAKAVADFVDKHFGAEVAIWGKVERIRADDYRLHVRIVDRRKNTAKPVIAKTYPSTLHGMVESVDAALDELLGVTRPAERDLLKETGWRNRKNLVKNGGFEKGVKTPEGWEPVDGLAIFWVEGKSPTGKCIMFDTMVEEPQYKKWRSAFAKGAPAEDAPKKIPPKPPYYGTIGGTVGAHIYSDPIPIQQGKVYRIDFDYKAMPGETKVFVKGYAPFFNKDGTITHREVYRRQINLYPKTNGQEWEHDARLIHSSQPFIILTIASDFDNDRTGERLRRLLAEHLAALGVNPIRDLKESGRLVKSYRNILNYKESKYSVARMVKNVFERGVVVWGEIHKEDTRLRIQLRSLDVREAAGTKDMWDERTIPVDQLAAESENIARKIFVNARPVTFLRVKLDAYWPPGLYYFDNISVTEEPETPKAK